MCLLVDQESSVIGRDAELAGLDGIGRAGGAGRVVVLVGDAGIGKTTVWEAAIDRARAAGVRVLAARASGSEARLAFAGLIDLFDAVAPDELAGVPGPQRLALEAALLRARAPAGDVATPSIALGFVTAVRALAAHAPALIAIDDLQWLDPPTAEVLAFAVRRLPGTGVGFLLARRPGRATRLERAAPRQAAERLMLGPLSLEAVRRMLLDRLGLTVSRQLLARVVDVTEGNPLFALEVGRSIVASGAPSIGEELPLPDSIREMVGARVARLAPGVRSVLLAVALSEEPTVDALLAVAGRRAVEDAIDTGVVAIDGERVRAEHPLLAAAARERAGARRRRELHRALAEVVGAEQLRALHLALATVQPDEGIATRLSAAAGHAFARGARAPAVQLAGHALRLTGEAAARPARVLTLADYLYKAGELHRVTELLTGELPALPSGPTRARALLLLGEAGSRTLGELDRQLEGALAECGPDAGLRAYLLAKKAANAAAGSVVQMRQADAWAQAALADAAERDVERFALYALAWTRALRGIPVDDLCARSAVSEDPRGYIAACPERVAAQRLVWRGEVEAGRAELMRLRDLADARGEVGSYGLLRQHLCALELRVGACEPAARVLEEWAESSDRDLQFRPMYERCRALLAAIRGTTAEAGKWATDAIERSRACGCGWDELEARRARAMALLLDGDPARARDDLRRVWDYTGREGVHEPGVFPAGPELVEALVELGELEPAAAIAERLGELASAQDHPWARASATRSRALLLLARRPPADPGAALLREAAEEYGRLGLRFDRARCLLSLGGALRRARKWGPARAALGDAASAFAELGATGWAEAAGSELARVGARRPAATGELTLAERRVVELAAAGRSNKEIALALSVAVTTVEAHLTHAYAKLGIRSRAQLARRLAAAGG